MIAMKRRIPGTTLVSGKAPMTAHTIDVSQATILSATVTSSDGGHEGVAASFTALHAQHGSLLQGSLHADADDDDKRGCRAATSTYPVLACSNKAKAKIPSSFAIGADAISSAHASDAMASLGCSLHAATRTNKHPH